MRRRSYEPDSAHISSAKCFREEGVKNKIKEKAFIHNFRFENLPLPLGCEAA
jgi:hypothetical protein